MALQNSPSLKIRRDEARHVRHLVLYERGAFFPTLASQLSYRREIFGNPIPLLEPDGTYSLATLQWQAGLSGLLPWGASYDFSLSSGVQWTSLSGAYLSPQNVNTVQLKLVQPLLKGWGWDNTTHRLRAARVDHAASLEQVKVDATDLMLRVVRAYWELVARRAGARIATQSVDMAKVQLEATRARVKAGNLPRYDLAEAAAAVASRQQELVVSRQQALSAERDLLMLIYTRARGRASLDLARSIRPTDALAVQAERRDLKRLVAAALRHRPEVQSLRHKVRAAGHRLAAAKNAALPTLDLEGSVGATSLSGTSTFGEPGHEQVGSEPPANISGGYGTAWKQVATADMPFWQVGLRFEWPLDRARRSHELEAQRVTLRRAEAELRQMEDRIALEVRDAFLRLRVNSQRVAAAEQGLDLARQNLEAARKKFAGGISTSYDVLRVQLDLARAELDLQQAIKEQLVASVELMAASGDLAGHLGIAFE